jgi:hypothetical protein
MSDSTMHHQDSKDGTQEGNEQSNYNDVDLCPSEKECDCFGCEVKRDYLEAHRRKAAHDLIKETMYGCKNHACSAKRMMDYVLIVNGLIELEEILDICLKDEEKIQAEYIKELEKRLEEAKKELQ